MYLYPFMCAAFSLRSISWAPTQLIPFPQRMPELDFYWVAICMSTKSLILYLNLRKQNGLLELVIWKSTVRLGKRRRESGLIFSRKTNPKIGFVHQKFIFGLSSHSYKECTVHLLVPLHQMTSTVNYVPLRSQIFTYFIFYPVRNF